MDTLSPVEVASCLGVATRTLERWRSANTGPAYIKVAADKVVYPRLALIDWLAEQIEIPEGAFPPQARRSLLAKMGAAHRVDTAAEAA